ncbi:Oidioi.mRNA.OKI2018_I69.XSR.g13402.t1.cds [Oikopleura dioica]|uniref:Oidioi.mRNA.OKI2018_I69.XSR.g13402.t1.cds n=1 Tax=Oikopleura dioica TaxID=34765 RepID=A0ABN7S6S5_OIKDI|nr:Oidioi.mRNA.OKI2018_I69.XSR.g13402.t1.cds [Oikopleura dioica]
MAMYKIAPVLQQYSIEDKEIMYKVAPIQSIAQADAAPLDLEVVESQQNELFDKLNSLSSRVNTVMSVLSKSAATIPKSNNGVKFIEKSKPLDIVMKINPSQCIPTGLSKMCDQLANRVKVEVKTLVHSSATGCDCQIFKATPNQGKTTGQVVLTVIYTTAVPETTISVRGATVSGIGNVSRFFGKLLDIYPETGANEVSVENWLDLADLISDPNTAVKERMAQLKSLDAHLSKNKFVCGKEVTVADFAVVSAALCVDPKKHGKSLKASPGKVDDESVPNANFPESLDNGDGSPRGVARNRGQQVQRPENWEALRLPQHFVLERIPEFWGGEPIWKTNQKAGHKSAVQFWVGSELKSQLPTYWEAFNASKPFMSRVDTIVEQLQYEDVTLGLLYFEEPDATGHKYGPDSQEVNDKLEELNNVFGYLIQQLEKNDLLENEHHHFMELIDIDNSYGYDCNAGIAPKNDSVKELLYQRLVDLKDPNLKVWLKEEIPADLYYSNNDRIQDIWLSSEVGYAIVYSEDDWGKTGNKFSNYGLLGMHGFDPHSADMHPIFFARGPDFANKREEQEPFTNLDLYPLCCFLLGVEPAPNNGSLAELHAYLVRPLDLALPIAMGVLFSFFILLVIVYAIYQQFWKWKPLTLLQDQDQSNIQYRGLS